KVPRQVIIRRAAELSAAGERWALEFAGAFIGKTVQVLVEKNTGQGPSRGYTDEYVEAIVPTQQVRRGEIENVIAKTTDGKAPILVCELKKHN
ncbi:MAG: hypothetical protein PHW14_06755, partial [Candidatus Omnitrophica bacterium]|nr:hypothetical protein [Candidatus Omnitrophota bacterium]